MDAGEQEDPNIRSRFSTTEEPRYLPPIHRLKMPDVKTQSAKVRWLWALGYSVAEISRGTGIKYQQVRNMVTTVPKRTSREDMPPLVFEIMDPVGDIEAILDAELDRSLLAGRKERAKTRAANQFLGPQAARAGAAGTDEEEEVDEITELGEQED